MTKDFLFELGCEELPATSLPVVAKNIATMLQQLLTDASLDFDEITYHMTPRRIAVYVKELSDRQEDKTVERKGPAVQAAFDEDNKPTKACEGFMKSCGAKLEQLKVHETPKGSYVVFQEQQNGRKTVELLPELFKELFAKVNLPKGMRWGDNDYSFLRPIHWIVMLYGKQEITTELFGVKSGNKTYGHRFLCNKALTVKTPQDYLNVLETKGHVIADFHKRSEMIKEQTSALAKSKNGEAIIDDKLLMEVTNLVEYPQAIIVDFDDEFLKIPQEALICSMQYHQKSFAIMKGDALLPYFITVSNINSNDNVARGNAKVMCARLSDAKFFYETDCKTTLASRTKDLKKIVFQEKLGSLHEKLLRVTKIAESLARSLHIDASQVERAVELSKSDLLTEMVGEFPELQGIMGYYYALVDGETQDVAAALKEQYLPRFSGDELPKTDLGSVLGLADRIDTMVSIFGIHMAPTGDKDPYALRRAAIAVVRIILEHQYEIDITGLIDVARTSQTRMLSNPNVVEEVIAFIYQRLHSWYQDQGVPAEVVNAVLAKKPANIVDIDRRVQAVIRFRQMPVADELAQANKRVKNILAKQNASTLSGTVNQIMLKDVAEKELMVALDDLQPELEEDFRQAKYAEMLLGLSQLHTPIDMFFKNVMVMDEDPTLRQNRLQILARLRDLFDRVADLSVLQ